MLHPRASCAMLIAGSRKEIMQTRPACLLSCWFTLFTLLISACNVPPSTVVPPTIAPATRTVSPGLTAETVRVGILVNRSAIATNQLYSKLMDYLSQTTGRPFAIVPLTTDDQLPSVGRGTMEFLFTNSLASVQARRLYKTTLLATLSRPQTGTKFAGVIIVRKDSGLQTVEDLRGKRVACFSYTTSAAGGVFQVYHLLQKGIDPFKDFNSFTEIGSQENVVLSVLNGTLDAGFVRTGMLEDMLAAGTLTSLDEIALLDRVEDDFFYPHSTALYPEWPFAALAGTDPELIEAVKAALLTIPADHPALAAANIAGFVPVEDYSALDDLIETLQLPGWDVAP